MRQFDPLATPPMLILYKITFHTQVDEFVSGILKSNTSLVTSHLTAVKHGIPARRLGGKEFKLFRFKRADFVSEGHSSKSIRRVVQSFPFQRGKGWRVQAKSDLVVFLC